MLVWGLEEKVLAEGMPIAIPGLGITGGITIPTGNGGICIWALSWLMVGGGGLIAWNGLGLLTGGGGNPNGFPDPNSTRKKTVQDA